VCHVLLVGSRLQRMHEVNTMELEAWSWTSVAAPGQIAVFLFVANRQVLVAGICVLGPDFHTTAWAYRSGGRCQNIPRNVGSTVPQDYENKTLSCQDGSRMHEVPPSGHVVPSW